VAGDCSKGMTVDEQVLVESKQRVVQSRAMGSGFDAWQAKDLSEIAPMQLYATFESAGGAFFR